MEAGRGIEEEGEYDLNSGQNIHPGNRVSRLNAIPWNLNSYLMSCQDEWNVRGPWFWLFILLAGFGFSGPGIQMLTNLYPWELCFGSSYIVLIHPPFVCAYCPEHISFSWGEIYFPLLCGFMFISLRLCPQKDKGVWYFLPLFFFLMYPLNGWLQALSPKYTLKLCSVAVRKTLLNLISDCFCSVCPKPGFLKWKNTERKAPIAYMPRKENPFSAAVHWSGPAATSSAAKMTGHSCCSTVFCTALRIVFGDKEKLQRVSSERSCVAQAAPGEGTRDLFYPMAQSAPFPQGMLACSGWYCSVLIFTVQPLHLC